MLVYLLLRRRLFKDTIECVLDVLAFARRLGPVAGQPGLVCRIKSNDMLVINLPEVVSPSSFLASNAHLYDAR